MTDFTEPESLFIAPGTTSAMTFETFVVCDDNFSALQNAVLMAENGRLGSGGAALYLYGDRGTGKTHLLSAIANGVSDLTALFIKTGELVQQCEQAWNNGQAVDIKTHLIDPDILLLDDIHFIKDHEQFQREILNVIELRLNADLAVVVTATAPPSSLEFSDKRLGQLVGSGSIERIGLNDPNAKAEILGAFIGRRSIPRSVIRNIAKGEDENGHTLREVAQALRAKREVRRLLYSLGYRLNNAYRATFNGEPHVVSQWRCDLDGRIHIVDLAYSPSKKTVLSRCWSAV